MSMAPCTLALGAFKIVGMGRPTQITQCRRGAAALSVTVGDKPRQPKHHQQAIGRTRPITSVAVAAAEALGATCQVPLTTESSADLTD